jgi:catechol 2,3-dioxygenase-like lactoylglutathione lyase family enzyme
MLKDGRIATRLPAQDLERARRFYAEKLGLHPVEERPGGLRYECAAGEFALFDGNYPSKGTGERAVWFHDSEGNLLGIGQPFRA